MPKANVAVGTVLLCPAVVVVVVGFANGNEKPALAATGVVLADGDVAPVDVPNANVNDFVAVGACVTLASCLSSVGFAELVSGVGSLDGCVCGEAVFPNPLSLMGLFINAANPLLTVGEGAATDTATVSGLEATLVGSCFGASTMSFAGVVPKLNPAGDGCVIAGAAGGKRATGCTTSSSFSSSSS